MSVEPLSIEKFDVFKKLYSGFQPPKAADGDRCVRFVKNADGLEFACRTVPKSQAPQRDPRALGSHFAKLSGLDHPHICKFVEVFEDKDRFYLIYEKAESQPFFTYIRRMKRFSEGNAADCVRQLVGALSVAHEQKLVHGRLTPSDVVVAQAPASAADVPHLKICDMGLTFVVQPTALKMGFKEDKDNHWLPDRDRQQRLIGTMAPEVAWGEVQAASQKAQKIDVWSVGVVAYFIVCGRPPFGAREGDLPKRLLDDVRRGEVVFHDDDWAAYPEETKDCVERMLRINAGLRPDAITILRHPWLKLQREKISKACMARILQNICDNAVEGPLKRVVLRIIAQSQLSPEQREDAERVFRALDRNCDGILGPNEIVEAIEKHLPRKGSDTSLVFQGIDRDGTGTVNLKEFEAVAVPQALWLTPKALWPVFHALDSDGSGEITLDEIRRMVLHLDASLVSGKQGNLLLEGVLREVEEEAGVGGALRPISFDEFVDLMRMRKEQARTWLQSLRRGTRRALGGVGLDVYGTASVEVKEWDWMSQSGSQSVYVNRSATGLRRSLSCELNGPASPKSPKGAKSRSVLLVGAPTAYGRAQPPRPEPEPDPFEVRYAEDPGPLSVRSPYVSPRSFCRGGFSPQSASPLSASPRSVSPRSEASPRSEKRSPRSPGRGGEAGTGLSLAGLSRDDDEDSAVGGPPPMTARGPPMTARGRPMTARGAPKDKSPKRAGTAEGESPGRDSAKAFKVKKSRSSVGGGGDSPKRSSGDSPKKSRSDSPKKSGGDKMSSGDSPKGADSPKTKKTRSSTADLGSPDPTAAEAKTPRSPKSPKRLSITAR